MILEGFFTLLSNILLFSAGIETVNSFPHPLSSEKEREYLYKFRNENDIDARNLLIKHNLRLVVFIAKKYVNYPDNDELISVGTMGLIKAINSFDPDKGTQLATYASRCIENEILMTMRNYKKRSQEMSIYDTIGSDKNGNDLPIIEVLQTDEESVYSRIDAEFLAKTVKNLSKKYLNDREKYIIEMRFGLNGYLPHTQQNVADKLGISRSYISRIEKKALSKLRSGFEKEGIQV